MNERIMTEDELLQGLRPYKKKSLDITIFVYDKDDNCIREHKKNFKDKDHRRWLNTMLYWAITNGYSIEINS
jgi:hypothetical protein